MSILLVIMKTALYLQASAIRIRKKNGFLIFKFLVQFSSSPFTSTNVKTLNFPKKFFKSFLSEFQTTARRQERMGQIPDCASEGRVRITGA